MEWLMSDEWEMLRSIRRSDITRECRCGCVIRKLEGTGPWKHLNGSVHCSNGVRAEPQSETS